MEPLTPDELHALIERLTDAGDAATLHDVAEATGHSVEDLQVLLKEVRESQKQLSLELRVTTIERRQDKLESAIERGATGVDCLPAWWKPEGTRFSSYNPHQEPTCDYSNKRSLVMLIGFRLVLMVAWFAVASAMFIGLGGMVYLFNLH